MTYRAVFIGIVLSIGLASFGYVNDTWFFFSYIGGDLLPTHAYGLLLIGLLLINPLLRLVRRFEFQGSEWAVMLSLMFMGSVLAGSAFFWQMPHPIVTPVQEQVRLPGWKEKDILQYAPRVMLVEQVFRNYADEHGIERKKEETWQQAVERAKEGGGASPRPSLRGSTSSTRTSSPTTCRARPSPGRRSTPSGTSPGTPGGTPCCSGSWCCRW